MERLAEGSIKRGLRTDFVGRNVFCYPVIGSTNDVAKELARGGAPEGTLVIADEQTAGRGRLGRRWLAPAGSSLLMSLIFYPDMAPSQAQRLTMVCSLGAAEAIEEVTGLEAGIKWPNDLVIGRKKLGGILTEMEVEGDRLDWVVGMGLNVNFEISRTPGIPPTATSLMAELGREVSRLELLRRILEGIEKRYKRLQAGESPRREWASKLVTLGRRVRAITPQGREEGWAEAVDEDGALLLRRDDGSKVRITAGDVTLRG